MSAGRNFLASENKPTSITVPVLAKEDTPCLHYIEFQTRIIKLIEKIAAKNLSSTLAFKELAEANHLFVPIDENNYQLWVNWPHRNGNRDILIVLSLNEQYEESAACAIHFYEQERFLSVYLCKDQFFVERNDQKPTYKKKWNDKDIQELISNFNEVIRAEKINYNTKNARLLNIESKDNKNAMFSKADFGSLIDQYACRHITYKIENVILKNAIKNADNSYSFNLNWLDNQNKEYPLKVCFSRTDQFYRPLRTISGYSWFITENALNHFPEYMSYNINPGQYYYSLTVYEINQNKSKTQEQETQILKFWLTLDALYGELHGVHKGFTLSGNEVINIYKYFDDLFKVKNTFICDESKLTNEDESIKIPMRLISAIATGKTWYEDKLPGVKLFDCKEFKTAHDGVITQNSILRLKALTELQQLQLKEWHEMLNSEQQAILSQLYTKYVETEKSTVRRSARMLYADMTIQDLTIQILAVSRKAKQVTPELIQLTKLLCDGLGFNNNEEMRVNDNAPDKWVKTRVKELLWNSYFWIKNHSEEKSEERLTKRLRIRHL